MKYRAGKWISNSSPLVSVIIPSYNHETFLYDCLRSVSDQSYENIELIFVDDCSTDNSFQFATNFMRTPFSARFVRVDISRNEKNLGAHDTINNGIKRAKGDLITVINSDDQFMPERVSQIVREMIRSNSDLGFSLVEVLNDGGDAFSSQELGPFMHFTVRQLLNLQRDVTIGFGLLRQNLAISTGNMIFARALYDAIGGFLPLKYCHDWDFILQSLFYCEPCAVPLPLYYYRLHPHNSFKGLSHMAEVETEVVLRRFFRRVIDAYPTNPLCPGPTTWPGYFEEFVFRRGMSRFLDRELGRGLKSWRIYEDPGT